MQRAPKALRLPVLILLMVLGAFVGNVIGELAAPYWPILNEYARLGWSPTTLSLVNILDFTIGFNLQVNPVGGLGALLMLIAWLKR